MHLPSIIRKHIFKADRLNLFLIANILLGVMMIVFLYQRFRVFWLTLAFSAVIFLIRFRRQAMGIHLTLEPVILLGVILLQVGGFLPAAIAVTLPFLFSDIMTGRFGLGTLISGLCKILTLLGVMFSPFDNLILSTMLSYIIFNEGLGTFLAFTTGTPFDQIITQVMTSSVIRLFYLNVFLQPLCSLLGC